MRIRGPLPALVAFMLSVVFLYLSILMVDDANAFVGHGNEDAPDQMLLWWGGLAFGASVVCGLGAVALHVAARRGPTPAAVDPLAPVATGVDLFIRARAFVVRLHQALLAMGGMVLMGGLGLVASASLVADGTAQGPFPIAGKIGVVRLEVWQVQVTAWAFVLLGIAMILWASEYRWARRLRAAWTAPAPEV